MTADPHSINGTTNTFVPDEAEPLRVTPKFGRLPDDVLHERRRRLRPLVEREVLPRLLLAHVTASSAARRVADDSAMLQFAESLLAADHERACNIVDALRAQGTSLETLYLDLLAPAGHHLRWLWVHDRCDLAGVTQGLSLLRTLLVELRTAFCGEVEPSVRGRSVLLAPAPGERITFEHVMVEEFFRRAGWTVVSYPVGEGRKLSARTQSDLFDVVWLSHSAVGPLDGLAICIREIRQASCHPGMGVMVGGTDFAADPERARLVGAHATASDGRVAENMAQTLVCLLDSNAGFRRRPTASN